MRCRAPTRTLATPGYFLVLFIKMLMSTKLAQDFSIQPPLNEFSTFPFHAATHLPFVNLTVISLPSLPRHTRAHTHTLGTLLPIFLQSHIIARGK